MPQSAQDENGWVVQVKDRHHVEFFAGSIHAVVEVDFGSTVGVNPDTLKVSGASGLDELAEILDAIVSGLTALGSEVEVIRSDEKTEGS